MPNLSLVGAIKVEIDHAFSITCSQFSVSVRTPTTVHKGAFGPIGIAQGVQDVTANMTFSIPSAGLEFDWDELSSKPTGFTVTYTAGAARYMLLGCRRNDKGISNNPGGGDATMTIGVTATEEIPA